MDAKGGRLVPPAGALELRPLRIDLTFFCSGCDGMASTRTCPHDSGQRLLISGTDLRRMLSQDEPVPEHFSRPEVLAILRDYYVGVAQAAAARDLAATPTPAGRLQQMGGA